MVFLDGVEATSIQYFNRELSPISYMAVRPKDYGSSLMD